MIVFADPHENLMLKDQPPSMSARAPFSITRIADFGHLWPFLAQMCFEFSDWKLFTLIGNS